MYHVENEAELQALLGLTVNRIVTPEESSHLKAEIEPKPALFGGCDDKIELKNQDPPGNGGTILCPNNKCSKTGVKFKDEQVPAELS